MPIITRRRFFGTVGAIAAIGLYTWQWEPYWTEFVERSMPIVNLPSGLAGKRLIQISDLHVGKVVNRDFLKTMLQRVNTLQPDLIVMTGDYMSCHGNEQCALSSTIYSELKPTPLGIYASLGNHDYGAGWAQTMVANEITDRFRELGIQTLRNQVANVANLQIVGLDDLWAGKMEPERVIPQIDPRLPCLTLCHNPDGVDLPSMKQIPGWVLSGHTHGGQCKPPFLPPPILPVKNLRYTAGQFDLDQQRTLYINRGLGHNIQARFNVRPEITVFRLQRA